MERESNVDHVKVEQVIHVCSVFGKGVEGDPVRTIHEYYALDGELIARIDTTRISPRKWLQHSRRIRAQSKAQPAEEEETVEPT